MADIARDRGITTFPITKSGAIRWIRAKGWDVSHLCRKRAGRGGGMEYHFTLLPDCLRNAIDARDMRKAVMSRMQSEALADQRKLIAIRASALPADARKVMDARAEVLNSIDGFAASRGERRSWAIPRFLDAVEAWLEVFDGATLKHTFVSAGGQEGRGINTNGGTISSHGAAWGSGGKGGLSGTGGFPSQGGWASAATVTDWIDLSGYTTPRIRITLGAGGLPGAGGAGWNSGDAGTPGRVVMSYSAARDVRADVLPLEPTAVGSFVTTGTGAGSFPDLGAGLWILHRNTATTGLGLGYVTVSPGNVVRAYQDGSATLISSQTPTYTGGDPSWTVFYAFYAMGSWG